MGLSDCVKCWETPCRCGHDYKDWSIKDLNDLITTLQRVLDDKEYTWNDFNKKIWKVPSFVVLRYRDSIVTKATQYVYAHTPENHGYCYSFWCITPNFRDPGTIHDLGECEWTNEGPSRYPPIKWRYMTDLEEKEFRCKLFRFDRKQR